MFHNISEAASYEAPGPNGGVHPYGEGGTPGTDLTYLLEPDSWHFLPRPSVLSVV